MNITPGDAMRGMPPADVTKLDPELEFDIASAIAANDLGRIFGMVARIAGERDEAIEALRIRLSGHFKRDFSKRTFNQFLERERDRARVAAPRASVLPPINISNRQLRDISGESIAALRQANDPPQLFIRSGEMVYIGIDEESRPKILAATESHLRGRLARSADFYRSTDSGDRSVPPPVDAVKDIFSLPPDRWGLPALNAIVEVPTLRRDGTLVDTPGYDRQSRLFYAPVRNLRLPPMPEEICSDHVDIAKTLIDEAIGEFPYADESSRANLYGLLLTPILRPALGGCTPLALVDAPQAGTGKSLLVDVFAMITTGRPAPMMPYPKSDEEMEKRIGSSLLGGRSMICFDNLEGVLHSPSLALVLTAKDYETRILGVSENMLVPNQATWVVTGNNIRPSGDMPRRCYHIRLDAQMSRPYQGRQFKHANLLEWVGTHRAELLHALLVIARSWFSVGAPCRVQDPLGSFESWHRTIGSILDYAGIDGFLGNLTEFLDQADETANQWESFLLVLGEYFEKEFTVAELIERIGDSDRLRKALPDRLKEAMGKKGDALHTLTGQAFNKRKDQRMGDQQVHLKHVGRTRTRASLWRVIIPESASAAGSLVVQSDQQQSLLT